MLEKPFPAADLRRNLGQPDRGFDGLDLTEEGTDAAEVVMPPMLEQASGFRRDLPVVGFGNWRHWSTCRRTRLMIAVWSYCCSSVESPLPSSNTMCCCSAHAFALLRLWNRRDELGAGGGSR